jgi:uncharacterized protein
MTSLHKIYFQKQILLFFSIFWIGTAISFGQNIPAKPNPPKLVNDLAHLMDAQQIQELESMLVEYDKSASTQITIVTISDLDGYPIDDYAMAIGREWGVGRKGKDNGLVILVSKVERKINISTGYGMEGVMPDMICRRIIENEMKPNFRQGNYFGGFTAAFEAIKKAAKNEYVNDDPTSADSPFPFLLFVILLIIILIVISNRGGGRGGRYYSPGGSWWVGNNSDWGSGGGSGWGSGGGSSGGGGFGGFGGGGFGGGGSSGSW